MEENITNAGIAIFSLFLGFILGLIYGWFEAVKACMEEKNNEK